jgi:hypothetical protein
LVIQGRLPVIKSTLLLLKPSIRSYVLFDCSPKCRFYQVCNTPRKGRIYLWIIPLPRRDNGWDGLFHLSTGPWYGRRCSFRRWFITLRCLSPTIRLLPRNR